jgi:NAD(P)H-hydrate epimerase
MGAGLVQIAVPRAILSSALSITPELIGLALGDSKKDFRLAEAAEAADALIIGPGLGRSKQAAALVTALLDFEKPAVIDADALNILSAQKKWPRSIRLKAVLTPHPGEMGRLARLFRRSEVPSDEQGRIDIAAEAARAFGQVILLKGHRTIVTDGQRIYVNTTGDSSLAKAGSGDVLGGIIGCLLGQKMSPFDAAIVGAYLHGRAGERAGAKVGKRSALARDVLDQIPHAIRDYEAQHA